VKLVFIYGAPGVGKLTTAKALADLTGYRLFHNHLAFDLAQSIFDFPSAPFSELSGKVRHAVFEAAARAKLPGLIFTFVYAAPDDDGFVAKVIETVEKERGEVHFVRLHCDVAAHEQRVLDRGRKAFGKITSVEQLRGAQARWNLTAAVPLRESLEIDNSALSADAAARRIAERFSLL
jgi:chloramphenicol 3-O-phosphotransferase